ncbi:hypothetical protein AP064_05505 [Candidatus Liberibacter solanacearum]|uniref:DNA-binding protein n=1 Tax=Candidatus Liberibacter solanacearum TaxID=556287 RepID=A0A0F4VK27_9HYPH|nr:XRE family transcriptional regulator [Candidatus Liberibacter solanacearum]KJZ81600.1 DNA-binding protein [Candidatus Liberibacter solanacearum]KQC48691.1 hypothetical protein AP064_05505 [Candidatus Liberibacter solanacearum]
MVYNSNIFKWARENAGLSLEEASNVVGVTGSSRLEQIEKGQVPATFNQVKNMAKNYNVPFSVFYLKEPPLPASQETDFRSLNADISPREQAILNVILSKVRCRLSLIQSVLEDELSSPLSFIRSAKIEDGVSSLVDRMKQDMGFIAKNEPPNKSTDLFNLIRNKIENMGVFVQLEKGVGPQRKGTKVLKQIGTNVFRGFAIVDDIAPFIVINSSDAKPAMSFTLIHELAHLYLGEGGISSNVDEGKSKIETFCNRVASQFLLPKDKYHLENYDYSSAKSAIEFINLISERWQVSRQLVLVRLLQDRHISKEMYKEINESYKQDMQKFLNKPAKEDSKDKKKKGGPTYYDMKKSNLGAPFINTIRQALLNNATTHVKASTLMNINPMLIEKFFKKTIG